MSFVFYDIETTGKDKAFDQILQFAAIQTDADFQKPESFEIRCRLDPHVVPSPGALRVTGISASQLVNPALCSHYQMVRKIVAKFRAWSPSMFMGYNSIDFDEHFVRHAFYKTLHAPYLTSFHNNTRTDILSLVQAAFVFAPASLAFPTGDKGKVSFRLEHVAQANGFNHANAHDALADVEATLFISRLIAERAPELWSAFMRFGKKASVVDFILDEAAFCFMECYGGRPYSWLVTTIGINSGNSSEYYAFNLGIDPEDLAALNDEDLAKALKDSPKPIRRIRVNAAPILMSAEDAPPNAAGKNLSDHDLNARVQRIQSDKDLQKRLIRVLESLDKVWPKSPHVEKQLYDSFIAATEQPIMDDFHKAPWEHRRSILDRFTDPRLKELGRRLIHCERPDLCDEGESAEHNLRITNRLLGLEEDSPCLSLKTALTEWEKLLPELADSEKALCQDHQNHLKTWMAKLSRDT